MSRGKKAPQAITVRDAEGKEISADALPPDATIALSMVAVTPGIVVGPTPTDTPPPVPAGALELSAVELEQSIPTQTSGARGSFARNDFDGGPRMWLAGTAVHIVQPTTQRAPGWHVIVHLSRCRLVTVL